MEEICFSVRAAFLELQVDRSVGQIINLQFVQPENSILITGLYTHMVRVTDLYTKGFNGWWNLHATIWKKVKDTWSEKGDMRTEMS